MRRIKSVRYGIPVLIELKDGGKCMGFVDHAKNEVYCFEADSQEIQLVDEDKRTVLEKFDFEPMTTITVPDSVSEEIQKVKNAKSNL